MWSSPPTRGRGLKLPMMEGGAAGLASPPTRGRGLKPFVFAAIRPRANSSPPTRGRGLKLPGPPGQRRSPSVAPHAGAWIETAIGLMVVIFVILVAPHAGAWIETAGEVI